MRIVVADYSGHPFQVQLSRELARRGHDVLHLHFAEFQTPKGRLAVAPDDPATLAIEPVSLGRPFEKYAFVRRRRQEIEVGGLFLRRMLAQVPDVVICSNLPLDALAAVTRGLGRRGIRFLFWQQDIYSTAIGAILAQKYGLPGRLVGRHYRRIERRVLRQSAAVVVISEDFVAVLRHDFGLRDARIEVIENWAPLEEITTLPRDNGWSRAHGLNDREVVLYTGTIGMKHDPGQLLLLAQALDGRPRAMLVVTSEGPAAEWLAAQAAERRLGGLKVLPFQPFAAYPQVLASADVLISVLEADAGSFSVPSKVLSYLCAGRAIVLSAPPANLAFRIVAGTGAGRAVRAGDGDGFVAAVTGLLDDPAARAAAAAAGRAYAERSFDITRIGERFERLCREIAAPA